MMRKYLFLFCLILINCAFLSYGTETPVKDFFDLETVESYHNNSKIQWNLAMSALSNYSFAANEKVLDIGCGDGKITAYIAKSLIEGSIVGVDISPTMLAFASKNYPSGEYPNLYFVKGDGGNLCYNEEFDTIVSFCTIHWIPNQINVFKGIYQSLKFGGSFLAVVPAKEEGDLFAYARELMLSEKWKPIFAPAMKQKPHYYPKDYAEILCSVGFTSSQVNTKLVENIFNSEQELSGWMDPFIKNLTPEQKSTFLEEYVQLMKIHFPPDSEGKIIAPAACMELYAQKVPTNLED